MKKIIALVSVFFIAAAAQAATYTIDAAHSQVSFKVRHLGISSVVGRFDTFEGSINFDAANVAASKASATIDVTSVNTSQAKRDGHLRTCDFFCTEKFPKMTFASKKVTAVNGNKFRVAGDLTLHGVTKEVELDVEYNGEAKGPDGKTHAAFSATSALNRKDFGLSWDKLTETGGIMVGSEIKIEIELEAVKD